MCFVGDIQSSGRKRIYKYYDASEVHASRDVHNTLCNGGEEPGQERGRGWELAGRSGRGGGLGSRTHPISVSAESQDGCHPWPSLQPMQGFLQ